MIMVSKITDDDNTRYDYVLCPKCGRGRLCDKPSGTKVNILQIHSKSGLEHIVLKCPKCSARYLISSTEDSYEN